MPITEREIVEAAKALADTRSGCDERWRDIPISTRFFWLEMAYAALRAARKVRG